MAENQTTFSETIEKAPLTRVLDQIRSKAILGQLTDASAEEFKLTLKEIERLAHQGLLFSSVKK